VNFEAERVLSGQGWPGFQLVFFDCDSTLSSIEGIDELARRKGRLAEVKQLTDAAMAGEVFLQSVYDRRLDLLRPTRAEIREVEQQYRRSVTPDVVAVIQALKRAGKELFVVSGGLQAAVQPFAEWLGIPRQNIRAVEVRYNVLSGQWWDYQQDQWGQRPDVEYLDPNQTPLIETHGKIPVIREIRQKHAGRALLTGDGISDLVARQAVDLMVGFGGVISRVQVAAADVFITANSLAPVLALALSGAERAALAGTEHQAVLDKGLALIAAGQVTFHEA
jgi:phosphoserine phosphatase